MPSNLKFEFHPRYSEIIPQLLAGDPQDRAAAARILEERDKELEDYLNAIPASSGGGGTGASLFEVHASGDGFSGFTLGASGGTSDIDFFSSIGLYLIPPTGTDALKVTCRALMYPADGNPDRLDICVEATLSFGSEYTMESAVVDGSAGFNFQTVENVGVFSYTSPDPVTDGQLFMHLLNSGAVDMYIYGILWIIEFTTRGGLLIPPPT